MTATARKIKATASVFELPQRLGILQYVEYEPPPREWCSKEGCPYEGVLTAEGCKRGICVRYRVWVHSRDGRRWEARERWRRRDDEDVGGCIRQQAAETVIALIAYALIGGPEERKAVRSGAWFVALAFLIFLIDVIGPYGLSSVYGGGPLLPFPYDLATVAAGAVILYVVAVLTAP